MNNSDDNDDDADGVDSVVHSGGHHAVCWNATTTTLWQAIERCVRNLNIYTCKHTYYMYMYIVYIIVYKQDCLASMVCKYLVACLYVYVCLCVCILHDFYSLMDFMRVKRKAFCCLSFADGWFILLKRNQNASMYRRISPSYGR